MKLRIHTDGGSRGNPGPAAVGVVVYQDLITAPLFEYGATIGTTTNNVAEYSALLRAFQWLEKCPLHPDLVEFFLDSQLVVEQMNGRYKIKDVRLGNLKRQIDYLRSLFKYPIVFYYIPREKNKHADQLVNNALDLRPSP